VGFRSRGVYSNAAESSFCARAASGSGVELRLPVEEREGSEAHAGVDIGHRREA
jgi:hypothetical protein